MSPRSTNVVINNMSINQSFISHKTQDKTEREIYKQYKWQVQPGRNCTAETALETALMASTYVRVLCCKESFTLHTHRLLLTRSMPLAVWFLWLPTSPYFSVLIIVISLLIDPLSTCLYTVSGKKRPP